MKIIITNDEEKMKVWKNALKLLNSDCPTKCCEWCDGR
jgi:hypothetical protein